MLFNYCHNSLARLLSLPCAHRPPLPYGRFSSPILRSFSWPHRKLLSQSPWPEWYCYLSSRPQNRKQDLSQKTGWESSSASRIYLSNVFRTYCLCFRMQIHLNCQTCIRNDGVCLYKKSGILCNGTVYSSQIHVRFQDYFLNYNLFHWKKRNQEKRCMYVGVCRYFNANGNHKASWTT